MTGMGYQCSVNVVQAAEHNTPQARTRAIFWASQMGHRLPGFSQPQNVVQTARQMQGGWHRTRRAAPFPTVSIGDALMDLSAFDWVNPHRVLPQTREQRLERERRSQTITQYNCEDNLNFVGKDRQPYGSQPVSEYQRLLRAGLQEDQLSNHVTLRWDGNTTQVIEQVCNVPLRPDADHRDLPTILEPWGLNPENPVAIRNKGYPGRIGRLDTEGIAGTCMTRMDPSGKNGKVSTLLLWSASEPPLQTNLGVGFASYTVSGHISARICQDHEFSRLIYFRFLEDASCRCSEAAWQRRSS
jgi:DNA (cytosine-5)-methyltransferase 1